MALTGVILRRALKAELIADPPIPGEMVFATDTGEHGWIDEASQLWWKRLEVDVDSLPDTVIAPGGVLPILDGSNLTGVVDPDTVLAPAGYLPALDGSALTNIFIANNVTAPSGILPALDGSNLTNIHGWEEITAGSVVLNGASYDNEYFIHSWNDIAESYGITYEITAHSPSGQYVTSLRGDYLMHAGASATMSSLTPLTVSAQKLIGVDSQHGLVIEGDPLNFDVRFLNNAGVISMYFSPVNNNSDMVFHGRVRIKPTTFNLASSITYPAV